MARRSPVIMRATPRCCCWVFPASAGKHWENTVSGKRAIAVVPLIPRINCDRMLAPSNPLTCLLRRRHHAEPLGLDAQGRIELGAEIFHRNRRRPLDDLRLSEMLLQLGEQLVVELPV